MVGFLASNDELRAARDGVVAIVVVVAGLGLVLAPWWWNLAQELTAERRERVRSQERAELAAHLHDSVLQTLALIQRRADSPTDVQRLARRLEISVKTVETHVSAVLRKLQLSSRHELTRWATDRRLI